MNTVMKKSIALLVLVLVLLCAASAWAAGKQIPTKISSDSLTYSPDGGSIIFKGAVKVVRPDIQINADVIEATLEKGTTIGTKDANANAIKRIVASGNVVLLKGNRKGTCSTAIYDMENDMLTLKGNPVLTEGKNSIRGEIIRLNLKDNRSEVVGGKKRVEAVFFTSGDEGEK